MGGGITAGLDYASSDAAVIMTADLQDPPELITELTARDGTPETRFSQVGLAICVFAAVWWPVIDVRRHQALAEPTFSFR